jgi:DNA primase
MSNQELLELVLGKLDVVKGPDERGEYIAWCPFHPDGNGKPPHRPNLNVSTRGFVCHACGEKGGLRTLVRRLGVTVPDSSPTPEAVYRYRDEEGKLLYEVVRWSGKRFAQRRPDGKGGWTWKLGKVRRVLYRLPELLAAPDATVFITEGEKDVERLVREGVIATTNPGGTGKWRSDYNGHLKGRDVVILPDSDGPGCRHARTVATSLNACARTVKVVELPGLEEKGDVSDWLDAGHTGDDLRLLAEV